MPTSHSLVMRTLESCPSRPTATSPSRSATGTPRRGAKSGLAGYQMVEPESGRYLGRDAPELAARGLRVAGVAGAGRHHADALGAEESGPAVRSSSGATPATSTTRARSPCTRRAASRSAGCPARSPPSSPALDAGDPWAAVVLREQRASPRDPRSGLTMLLAPAAAIELREHSRRPPPS